MILHLLSVSRKERTRWGLKVKLGEAKVLMMDILWIFSKICTWKNFENWLTVAKVIMKNKWFLRHSVDSLHIVTLHIFTQYDSTGQKHFC